MDIQDHGVLQQWDERPGLVSGKSASEKSYYYWQRQLFEAASRQHHFVQPTFAEITPPQGKQAAVPAVTVRCAGKRIFTMAQTQLSWKRYCAC